jgi:hypothetical protein
VLHIHSAQTKILESSSIKINNEDISVTKIDKLLGVQITDTINWKAHCDEVVS